MTISADRTSRAPIDPRLWHYSRSARRYLVLSVVLSVVTTAAIVVSALMIGEILAGVIVTADRRTIGSWVPELVILACAVAVRVATTWLQARFGHRAATQVVAELEGDVLAASVVLPPRELDSRRGELATVLTRGLQDLRPYLAGYLPALLLAVIVPPCLLIVIATQDLTSAGIIAITLPLIPVFMILIGLLTRGVVASGHSAGSTSANRTLTSLSRLSDQLLDLLAGLPTLRALGREKGPAERVRELGDGHRRTAMKALRVAFLSSMVLELLATLSVALVAVSIGLRLVFGDMALQAGIIALILAPEVYLPLRSVGERFHAAEDGMAAAGRAFGVLGASADVVTGDRFTLTAHHRIDLARVSVQARDRTAPHRLEGTLRPGSITVLTGPNGSGKSTALQAVLGLVSASSGRVLVDGIDVTALDRDWWWSRVAWLPQRPVLIPGSLRENLELTGIVGGDIAAACAATGFDDVLADLPDGWDTVVGAGGVGLSLGQRQRLALTRVLLTERPVLLLDEPTAHLDAETEAAVLHSIVGKAASGATVVMVGHRPAVLAVADRIVEVNGHD
ncbi:thiol reductant ABC exporter subunit CydD [Antrihabitans cavernicola]|uniref:Thiol reductant ABC exporter subunit CydD n=1 Tax=Antrihabitans cavernicola TaxID=2495913 RepID=A0A5A7S6U2_9NOCA|nr:thiol reductant ABC exporter subunit CydD [Spelaeibacter cavernicola]KAA0021860.1 thiol reductant ABC exporter subunit CydD [Spelaeibacter cavernicola]